MPSLAAGLARGLFGAWPVINQTPLPVLVFGGTAKPVRALISGGPSAPAATKPAPGPPGIFRPQHIWHSRAAKNRNARAVHFARQSVKSWRPR